MPYTKLKDYDWLLEQIKQVTRTNTQQQPPVVERTMNMNMKMKKKNTSNTALFPSYNRTLRAVDCQPIYNKCKKVNHTERAA